MSGKGFRSLFARRLFLSRLGIGAGLAAGPLLGASAAAAQSAGEARWQPARHAQDDWYDKIPGQHRFVFDTTSPEGMATALQFANNFFEANKNSYGLQDSDLAVLIVARHKSTTFGYNDAIWAKYSKQLSEHANNFTDPKTKEPPVVNVYATSGNGSGQAGRMDALLKRGVHLAVCQMATRNIAGMIARASGGNTDTIFSELGANLVSNAQLVPAGIVAVNRAQERGYAFVHAG
jgi:intracellular sulfur oxidation DsrE/DsrF family protein